MRVLGQKKQEGGSQTPPPPATIGLSDLTNKRKTLLLLVKN